jgi:proteic killer suppression protein
MIASFRSKALRHYFEAGDGRRLSVQSPARIGRILRALNVAEAPADMNLPGLRFHALKGDQRSRYAVSANANWRITFGWERNDAVEVDLEDYH